jgi:hypothetical protein
LSDNMQKRLVIPAVAALDFTAALNDNFSKAFVTCAVIAGATGLSLNMAFQIPPARGIVSPDCQIRL